MSEERAMHLMRRQHGVISRRQAQGAGMTSSQINYRVATNRWVRVGSGLYRHATAPATWHSSLVAACLRMEGMASHRSAAVLHGIEGFRPIRREVVVPVGRGRRAGAAPGVVLHESSQLDLAGRTEREGVPCTGLARTLLDLAGCVTNRRLGAAVDAVLREQRLRASDLYGVVASHSRPGRPGCRRLREVLDDRLEGGALPLSDWSRMVADLLVASGLPCPVFEYQVVSASGGLVAQVDLAYPAPRVAIELDSVRWHLNRESFHRDPRRRNRLVAEGWVVLSFTWRDSVDDGPGLCATVRTALSRQRRQ